MAIRLRYEPVGAAKGVIRFASSTVLQTAIVLLGLTFGLGQLVRVGRASLPVMLGTLAIALVAAWLIGRALRVDRTQRTLIGVGTAICGASAIGAVSPIVGAAETEVAYAVSTIFVFNVVAVVCYPAIGHLLGLSQQSFGVWAGTAVNDTSSVVAASSAYGTAASQAAVVTKLARTTMIVPIALALTALEARRGRAQRRPVRKLLPVFLLWFLLASALNTAGFVDGRTAAAASHAATFLIAVALGAIGLSTRVGDLRRAGPRPFVLGTVLWALVGISGLLLQAVS
jgi:uncharacterized integral membrane protein (TIGR00698 family)